MTVSSNLLNDNHVVEKLIRHPTFRWVYGFIQHCHLQNCLCYLEDLCWSYWQDVWHVCKSRCWNTNDVQEFSLLPNVNNDNLLMWVQRMVTEGICLTIVPTFSQHKEKFNKFKIELITVVCGKHLKTGVTDLESLSQSILLGTWEWGRWICCWTGHIHTVRSSRLVETLCWYELWKITSPVLLARPDKNRGCQVTHVLHCYTWYGLLERDNRGRVRTVALP